MHIVLSVSLQIDGLSQYYPEGRMCVYIKEVLAAGGPGGGYCPSPGSEVSKCVFAVKMWLRVRFCMEMSSSVVVCVFQ